MGKAELSCRKCGTTLVEGNPFCVQCGTEAEGMDAHTPPPAAVSAAGPRAFTPAPIAAASGPRPMHPNQTTPVTAEERPDLGRPQKIRALEPLRHSGPVSEPVIPLPSTARTQPIEIDEDEDPTLSGKGPIAKLPLPSDDGMAADEPPMLKAGDKVLKRYRIVRVLGQGGMGAVYLARDDLTEQQVAVKVLPAALAREKGIRQRFTLEAKALASLDHPNIVPLISYDEDGDDRFLVMKYVEGTALDELIEREGKLGFDRAREIFEALVSALGYAHERGVIHRDVKPANVLIGKDGRIFLVDFGIAKKQESVKLTQTGMLMGTPQYMSPEQISGHPIDGRNDLYAAGLILFEMLAGRAPFVGDRTFTVLRAHVESPVPDPEMLRGEPIPTALLVLIDRLLKKQPDERPPDAKAALALLEETDLSTPAFGEDAAALVEELARGPTPMESADELEREITAAFGQRRNRSMTMFAVGAVALAAAAIVVVVAFPGAIGGGTDETKQLTQEDIEADTYVAGAKKKLDQGNPKAALMLLSTVPEKLRNRADVISVELDCYLRRRMVKKAEPLLATLKGNEARLGKELRRALKRQEKELQRIKKGTAVAARNRAAKLPNELTNAQILAVTHGKKSGRQLRDCWEHTVLRADPNARGTIQLKARIKKNGVVGKVRLTKQTVGDARFRKCVIKTAKRWRFPEVSGPDTDVVQTFDFEPAGG